ncbi:MAG: dicarboxylate/amino acid:cation symporter [Candidatus Dependentiae bacterium]
MNRNWLTSHLISLNSFILIAAGLGTVAGLYFPQLYPFADVVSETVISLLKLISLPLIFFSVTATISGMSSVDEMRLIGRKVIKYTISTTVIAATVALIIFLIIDPTASDFVCEVANGDDFGGYFDFMCKLVPSNVVTTFAENNVIGIMLIALGLSFATLTLPEENKQSLNLFFSSFFAVLLRITQAMVYVIPVGVWAFTVLFIKNIKVEPGNDLRKLALYVICILLANFVQGFIVLPLFLKWKGYKPFASLKGMSPALSVAFFSRSSNIALPMTMECTQRTFGVSEKVSNITLPLCSTINMNACAAFILTTVLFVAQSSGMVFSLFDMILWIFIATIAAIGNAGVPMGCYFLSGALLTTMNVPLELLGVILPLYALIDMFETAVNVWSDSCVAAMVQKEVPFDTF